MRDEQPICLTAATENKPFINVTPLIDVLVG